MSNFHGGYGAPRLRVSDDDTESYDSSPTSKTILKSRHVPQNRVEYHRFGEHLGLPSYNASRPNSAKDTIALYERLRISIAGLGYTGVLEDDWENKNFPSGYVYLLQLAGHDLVQTSMPIPRIAEGGDVVRNLRRSGLELETIFGGGPANCPHAYVPEPSDGDSDPQRRYLKLGDMKPKTGFEHKDRDIPRSTPGEITIGCKVYKNKGFRDVLIADPRNDDNSILSQMTALFHSLHNKILKCLIINKNVDVEESQVPNLSRAMLSLLYRDIIKNRVLNLILHPGIYSVYDRILKEGEIGLFLDNPVESDSRPIEFAYAASRIGHFLVRPSYFFNSESSFTLSQSFSMSFRREYNKVPAFADWGIDWKLFFTEELCESLPFKDKINWAPRIRAKLNAHLVNIDDFPVEDDPAARGLLLHDLIRSADAMLPSSSDFCDYVRDVVGNSAHQDGEKKFLLSLIPGSDDVKKEVALWLDELIKKSDAEDGLDPENDVTAIVEQCPLLIYLIIEAESQDCNGERLGPVASILFAEVFFRALYREGAHAEWDDEVRLYAEELFAGTSAPQASGTLPVNMRDLIDRVNLLYERLP